MKDGTSIGTFNVTDTLNLRRAPNGGWVVSADGGGMGRADTMIGAYTSATEMLAALDGALNDSASRSLNQKPTP